MSIKSTIAALAASPFLFAGAAFAGPYVNVEANASYPDGDYTGATTDVAVGFDGSTSEGKIAYYIQGGPAFVHSETADEFGDVELAGYLGASKALTDSVSAYGEVYGQTTSGDDREYSAKAGVKFVF